MSELNSGMNDLFKLYQQKYNKKSPNADVNQKVSSNGSLFSNNVKSAESKTLFASQEKEQTDLTNVSFEKVENSSGRLGPKEVGSVEFIANKVLNIKEKDMFDIKYNQKGQVSEFKWLTMFGDGKRYNLSYTNGNKIEIDIFAINNNGKSFNEFSIGSKTYYVEEE